MAQNQRLYELLSDGKEHSTREICSFVYGGDSLKLARVAARIDDLRRGKWKGKIRCEIPKAYEHDGLYWYCMENVPQGSFGLLAKLRQPLSEAQRILFQVPIRHPVLFD